MCSGSMRGRRAAMGRQRSYENILRNGQEKKYLAYARNPEDANEIDRWLDGLKTLEKIGLEIDEVERSHRETIHKEFGLLYGVIPFEQYNLLHSLGVRKISRREIIAETGKSTGALRKLIHDTKQTLKRMGLWNKYRGLFD
jgi:hypothetical protein